MFTILNIIVSSFIFGLIEINSLYMTGHKFVCEVLYWNKIKATGEFDGNNILLAVMALNKVK